jgi:hypothetical protein
MSQSHAALAHWPHTSIILALSAAFSVLAFILRTYAGY